MTWVTTLQYYLHETNPANGLIRDKTDPKAPCSIAAVGLGLATIPVLVERGVVSREFAPEIAPARRLRFPYDCLPRTRFHRLQGFYYHSCGHEGRTPEFWQCRLSTVDSYFSSSRRYAHLRRLLTPIRRRKPKSRHWPTPSCRRADWRWALNGGVAIARPGNREPASFHIVGPVTMRAAALYLLGLGSPTTFQLLGRGTACRLLLELILKRSMVTSSSIPARSSRTNSRTCGSISAICATLSCASTAPTTSRTAAQATTFHRVRDP